MNQPKATHRSRVEVKYVQQRLESMTYRLHRMQDDLDGSITEALHRADVDAWRDLQHMTMRMAAATHQLEAAHAMAQRVTDRLEDSSPSDETGPEHTTASRWHETA